MSILKLRSPDGDLAVVRTAIDWLAEHGIPAGDAYTPVFVDTDDRIIYWSACVYPAGGSAYTIPETSVPCHDAVVAFALPRYGLSSAAVEEAALVAVLQKTPMLSPPPAEIVAGA